MSWQRVVSILWFPVFFAIVLPVTLEVAFHQPTPHHMSIAVVDSTDQVRLVTSELDRVRPGGFEVRQSPSAVAATTAVRDRTAATAYVATGANLLHSMEKPRNAMRGERDGAIKASGQCWWVMPGWPSLMQPLAERGSDLTWRRRLLSG